MQVNYSEYMGSVIDGFPFGTPIFTDAIVRMITNEVDVSIEEIKNIVNLNLKRLADNHTIERIKKGVYYKPKMTVFGKTKPPIDLVITETCIQQDEKLIGYIGGETLLHQMGLTTLLAKDKTIVTNKHRVKVPMGTHIVLKKPVVPICEGNAWYLQTIDAIAMLDAMYIDAENPREIIRNRVAKLGLDELALIKMAKQYYSQKVLLTVLDVILEDEDEVAQG